MNPVILVGGEAYPVFRLNFFAKRLSDAIRCKNDLSILARQVFFIGTSSALSKGTELRLAELLGTSEELNLQSGFFVIPRKGTISPWSSKVSDILTNCGLTEISRIEKGVHFSIRDGSEEIMPAKLGAALNLLHDRMIEGVYTDISDIFCLTKPETFKTVDLLKGGIEALHEANAEWGLALSDDEVEYLFGVYKELGRNPSDVELMMFGQVNSEHCRHKIFNAQWVVDGRKQGMSLFEMIKNTHKKSPSGTLVAYKDNAGVLEGFEGEVFGVEAGGRTYESKCSRMDMVIKAETHNHPTAISPSPGSATGTGGEIRDEAATGTGAQSKAGFCGIMVSNLRIPGFAMPWEKNYAEPPRNFASPLQIMIDAPMGGAACGNEFGRPQLFGMFKTFEEEYLGKYRGYHKPIMLAGGMGNIRRPNIKKRSIPAGSPVIQLGGPAMKIGVGGGAASSLAAVGTSEELDFNSVQRDHVELQRRCQEVIDACFAKEENNPILSIHDIGAGGLSNACPELVAESGASFELRNIHSADPSMTPLEIWCCEAQERYVLSVLPERLEEFEMLCKRERCPMAVIGTATGDGHLLLTDKQYKNKPIDIDLSVILGRPPKMVRDVKHDAAEHAPLGFSGIKLDEAIERVLRLPAVAAKTFLITGADRTAGGVTARDQLVGPYQVPVADAAVTTTTLTSYTGEAMSIGERTVIALVNPAASARMAVGEALTNIVSANVSAIGAVKLSANWMCACGEGGEDAGLFDAVRAVGMELCPALGVSIPVGKDSLSMRTVWSDSAGKQHKMTSPMSLVVSSFAPVCDVTLTVTPDLKEGDSVLVLFDLGAGKNRTGCSALARVYNRVGSDCPDLDDPAMFVNFFQCIQELIEYSLIDAYHDRSDGGLFVTVAEMAFAGRRGVELDFETSGKELLKTLFAEELGAVVQVQKSNLELLLDCAAKYGLTEDVIDVIGIVSKDRKFSIKAKDKLVYERDIQDLHRKWCELTYQMQSMRDNPKCALEEFEAIADPDDPGINFQLPQQKEGTFNISGVRPKLALLREQGLNGYVELAAAFDKVGFEVTDIHMTELVSGKADLREFQGLIVGGSSSYGNALGAGQGWAKSILMTDSLKEKFANFFARSDTFSLGVNNGCQLFALLREIIPGAELWPDFVRNKSDQFESRFVTVEVMKSTSIFFEGMEGARLGVPVSHAEGQAMFRTGDDAAKIVKSAQATLRFVDNYGAPTARYPLNPNGSVGGLTGFTSKDGRVTIMMPHPERAIRPVQMSYYPDEMCDVEETPWAKMFRNARRHMK